MDHPPEIGHSRNLHRVRTTSYVVTPQVHHNAELVRICHDVGVLLEDLPPHSPDLNSIETSFSVPKQWIKRHQNMATLHFNEGRYGDFIDLAGCAPKTRCDTGNFFRRSGIYCRSRDEMDGAEALEKKLYSSIGVQLWDSNIKSSSPSYKISSRSISLFL